MVAVVAVVIGAGMSWATFIRTSELIATVRGVDAARDTNMTTLTNSWVSGGETITVSTTQGTDETYDDFVTRHDARVAARKLKYPPDA